MKLCELICLTCVIKNVVSSSNSSVALKQLYRSLLLDYDTRLRPLADQHRSLDFKAFMVPTNILELDTAAQKLTISAHFGFHWNDEFLRWNLSDSEGIDILWFPLDQIWHPIVVLSMSYDGRLSIGNADDVVAIRNTGDASLVTEGIFKLVCEVNIEYYPFDTQECKFDMYINDVPRDGVNLLPYGDGIVKDSIRTNPEWHILDMKAESIYEVQMYVQLMRYRFLLRRRATFIMYTTVGPLIVLSFLNAIAFLVPIESGEKGSIVMTMLLSFCLYISTTGALLPPNSNNNCNLLVFMTILEANSAFVVLYTMVESYLHAKRGGSPTLLRDRNLMKCLYRSKAVEPDADAVHDNKENDVVEDDRQAISEMKFHYADVAMFFLFVIENIIVLAVFVGKVRSSFRETLTN